ncbi:MAG TPA: hypothetical protein VFB12_08765 [Ktedonobacteraceae bacterium]|nr:hypothetical protein [Ktedonobacteraceae bacterium]
MAIKIDPDVRQPETRTSPRRSGGWFRKLQQRIRLALSGSDDELVLENKTGISWRVYHDYHWLGTIDPGEHQTFKLEKRGTLNVRPSVDGDDIEYLVLPLDIRIHRVRIYQRRLAQDVEVYDMRAA